MNRTAVEEYKTNLILRYGDIKHLYWEMSDQKSYQKMCEEEQLAVMELICENGNLSCSFARFILKGPFKLGEPAIATDPNYSYEYAKYVLNDRFELGELIISNAKYTSWNYANIFLDKIRPDCHISQRILNNYYEVKAEHDWLGVVGLR